MPERISSYILATRWGVSSSPSRFGSSPTPSSMRRTPSSIFLWSTAHPFSVNSMTQYKRAPAVWQTLFDLIIDASLLLLRRLRRLGIARTLCRLGKRPGLVSGAPGDLLGGHVLEELVFARRLLGVGLLPLEVLVPLVVEQRLDRPRPRRSRARAGRSAMVSSWARVLAQDRGRPCRGPPS